MPPPTEAGRAILAHARSILEEMRDLKSIAARDEPSGELRLGATGSATSGLLPGILTLMAARYPQIEIYMLSGNGAELYQKVLHGELDAAIISQPPFAVPKAYEWRTLREERLIVLAPKSGRVRDPRVLLTTKPFIRPRRNSWLGQLVDGYLRKAHIRPRERFELDTLEAIAVMVDQGLGVSLMPDWAPPWPEGLSLSKLPVPDGDQFSRRLGLIWSRDSVRIPLVRTFLDVAISVLKPMRAAATKSRRLVENRREQ
jgi:DNA-binding transcriptional LysR family regulator